MSKNLWKVSSRKHNNFNDITVEGNIKIYVVVYEINKYKKHCGIKITADKIYIERGLRTNNNKIGNIFYADLDGDQSSNTFVNMKILKTDGANSLARASRDINKNENEILCEFDYDHNFLKIKRLYTFQCLNKMYDLYENNGINCVGYVNLLLAKFQLSEHVREGFAKNPRVLLTFENDYMNIDVI